MTSCPICGKPIARGSDSDREHVLPQWLLDVDQQGSPSLTDSFPLISYTLKVHKSCNRRMHKLEDRVKPIFFALYSASSLSVANIEDLLDWLHFLRLKLFWAELLLEKYPITPRIIADSRVGSFDRMVIIGRSSIFSGSVRFGPYGDNVFMQFPVYMMLSVNGLYFLNCSWPGAFAPLINAPAVREIWLPDESRTALTLSLPDDPEYPRQLAVPASIAGNGLLIAAQARYPHGTFEEFGCSDTLTSEATDLSKRVYVFKNQWVQHNDKSAMRLYAQWHVETPLARWFDERLRMMSKFASTIAPGPSIQPYIMPLTFALREKVPRSNKSVPGRILPYGIALNESEISSLYRFNPQASPSTKMNKWFAKLKSTPKHEP